MPLLSFLCNSLGSFVVAVGLPALIQWHGHKAVERQDIAFFHDLFAGQVATRIAQVASSVKQQLAVAVWVFPNFIVQMIGSFALMATLAWPLAVPVVFWIAANALVARLAIPNFSATAKNSAYRQQIPTAYAHIDGSRKYGRLSIDGGLEGGIAFAAKATDNHWLRDLEFTDEFDFAPTFGASLGASYTLTPKASLYLTANYDFTNLDRGDTKTYNTSTGVRNSYKDAAGATLRTIYVGAGLKGSFRAVVISVGP